VRVKARGGVTSGALRRDAVICLVEFWLHAGNRVAVDFVPGFRHAQWSALMRLRGVYNTRWQRDRLVSARPCCGRELGSILRLNPNRKSTKPCVGMNRIAAELIDSPYRPTKVTGSKPVYET
jgi:hypothetical protein